MLEYLPPLAIEGHQLTSSGSPKHPMRKITRRAAGLEPGGWTDAVRAEVRAFFDDAAPEWHTRTSPQRTEIVRDALRRGLAPMGTPQGLAVEVGSGIGTYSRLIADYVAPVVAVDLSLVMLSRAPSGPAHRVQADAAALPIAGASAALMVLINAFLFPQEVARVLKPEGIAIWVNSSGDRTPIYLSAEDLVAALPGAWSGVWSHAGAGHWCVLKRGGASLGA